jgi:hypothetical protein
MSTKLETVHDRLAGAHILLEGWAFGPVRDLDDYGPGAIAEQVEAGGHVSDKAVFHPPDLGSDQHRIQNLRRAGLGVWNQIGSPVQQDFQSLRQIEAGKDRDARRAD